jgi:hypothetical protein
MIDNDQTTIIEAPEVYKSIPTHSPTATPTTECTREKNVDFDTFDGHVMVNNIEPNFQEFIFGPKSRFDHSETILGPFKKLPFLGPDPLPMTECTREKNVNFDTFDGHVMVNYIEPNLQEFIFGPIRVGLITQKQFWDHLKNCHSWGQTPYICTKKTSY